MQEFWAENLQSLLGMGWDVKLFSERLSPFVRDKAVLELGCGAGMLSLSLARWASSVTGVDFQPALIEIANQNATQSQYADRVRFVQQDILALDLGQKFDVICGTAVIHEIPAPFYPGLIGRIKSHINEDGFCVFLENNSFNPIYRFLRREIIGRFGFRKVGSQNETPFDPERYEIIRRHFQYAERRCDVFLLLDRMWYQFFHYRLERFMPSVACWIGALMTRGDLFVTHKIGHNPITLYWTWVPTIYFSDFQSREF